MAQFFTNEAVSLEKKLETNRPVEDTPDDSIEDKYETKRCIEWVRSNGYKKVCLQFPDFLLCDSSKIAFKLQSELNQTIYILGDTAYESCCLDYVAAAHVEADAIIHFGPTCFSKPSGDVPSLFIHEKYNLRMDDLSEAFKDKFADNDQVEIILDTPYLHLIDDIRKSTETREVQIRAIGDQHNLNAKTLYIGANDRKLTNFKLIYKPKELYFFNNTTGKSIADFEMDARTLKKRYFLIEKIKDSKTVGIIIGTLAVRNYRLIIERMKRLLRANGKKFYMLSVGKPNVAKLANFPEMDVYVLISCSMNEIFDSRDFYKPIVTPYDTEIALNPNSSQTDFTYDFETLFMDDLTDLENNLDQSDVSLLTGNIRCRQDEAVVERNGELVIKSTGALALKETHGAGFLAERSWKGLERNLNETEAKLAEEGRKGIAQGYANEGD